MWRRGSGEEEKKRIKEAGGREENRGGWRERDERRDKRRDKRRDERRDERRDKRRDERRDKRRDEKRDAKPARWDGGKEEGKDAKPPARWDGGKEERATERRGEEKPTGWSGGREERNGERDGRDWEKENGAIKAGHLHHEIEARIYAKQEETLKEEKQN
jgi:hypothetical protein